MKYIRLVWILVLISQFTFSQIKGVVKDSLTGKPIPYVTIWVEHENIGTTSEEDGTFEIKTSEKSKNLIFTAIGFKKKKVGIYNIKEVWLQPVEYMLDEIVVANSKATKVIEIGQTKSSISQAFDNGPKIVAKYFPYKTSYKATRYIKKVTVLTDSEVDNATVKLHFYTVDSLGFPSKELLKRDFIVTVKKGIHNHVFDVSNLNLTIPKSGLFVGFEKLLIEKNKLETIITDFNSNTTKTEKKFYPLLLFNFIERDFQFEYFGGTWNKQQKFNSDGSVAKMMIYEPSINLILTN